MFVSLCVELGCKKEVNLVCDPKDQWLLDSGATIHICTDKNIMEDKQTVNETVMVGDKLQPIKNLHADDDRRWYASGTHRCAVCT